MTTTERLPYKEYEAARWERIKVETYPLWKRIHQLRLDYQARNWYVPQYVILSAADLDSLAQSFSLILPQSICGLPIRQTKAFVSLTTTFVGGRV